MPTYTVKLEYGKQFEFRVEADSEDEAVREATARADDLISHGEVNLRSTSVDCEDEEDEEDEDNADNAD